jgi:hypothetical protein
MLTALVGGLPRVLGSEQRRPPVVLLVFDSEPDRDPDRLRPRVRELDAGLARVDELLPDPTRSRSRNLIPESLRLAG